jgi:hypothetical protein
MDMMQIAAGATPVSNELIDPTSQADYAPTAHRMPKVESEDRKTLTACWSNGDKCRNQPALGTVNGQWLVCENKSKQFS